VLSAWPSSEALPQLRTTDTTACNGQRSLCARRYDEVSYAATHNSMAAGDEPGWFLAEQPTGVIGQLDDGVRAFLIDSWYGRETERPGVIATAERQQEAALRQAEEIYGRALLESALRVRNALGLTPRGPENPYLCHGFCELGATRWLPLMEQVRAWLEVHPGQVITFVVQDLVTPADTAALVEEAGLLPYVHTQRPGEPWPTLREMVDSGRRVVFFMEEEGGGAAYPWLLSADDWMQDTPFLFRSPSQFSCDDFRGEPGTSLFLLNHWLSNPGNRVRDAERVNSTAVLGSRARLCERERGLLPNFVAVDYYDRGDLFRVVDRLNRL
jgi:hypothetical protein